MTITVPPATHPLMREPEQPPGMDDTDWAEYVTLLARARAGQLSGFDSARLAAIYRAEPGLAVHL